MVRFCSPVAAPARVDHRTRRSRQSGPTRRFPPIFTLQLVRGRKASARVSCISATHRPAARRTFSSAFRSISSFRAHDMRRRFCAQITMPPAKKKTAEGPKYSELIKAALLGLKERNGSSLAAIKKYMASNFPAAKVRPTRHRAACRITYLHPVVPSYPSPSCTALLLVNLPPSPRVPPSLPLPQTKTTHKRSHGARVPPSAERPGAQERAQVRRLQGHVHQGQGVLQALARGQGALPPTRLPPTRLPPTRPAQAQGGQKPLGRAWRWVPRRECCTRIRLPNRPSPSSAPHRAITVAAAGTRHGAPPEPMQCARTLG